MTVVIRDIDFQVASRSRNLRGILEYSRRHPVERVDIWEARGGAAQLGIAWSNGSTCVTDFASFEVCKRWCAARRNFPPARIHADQPTGA